MHVFLYLTVFELSNPDYLYKYTYTKVTSKFFLPSAERNIVSRVLKSSTLFVHDFSIISFSPKPSSLLQELNGFSKRENSYNSESEKIQRIKNINHIKT